MISKTSRQAGTLFLVVPFAVLIFLYQTDYLWLEVLLLAALPLADRIVKCGAKPPGWCAPLRRISRERPLLTCAIPAITSAGLRLLLLPWIPVPRPVITDEYSHTLLAKTLLAGRLANPSHPLWPHFESIHILSQPTYGSMYLTGQALSLAAGKLLTGHLFGGVVIGTMMFCAAVTWFLQAYVPPGWALYGGMLAAVRFGAASYWNNSYWGASVAAFGAAVILGAFPRYIRSWRPALALTFTVGCLILINTRPYEGLGLIVTLLLGFAYYLFEQRQTVSWRGFAVGVSLSLLLTGAAVFAMTTQWKAVTGDRWLMPYQMNQRIYGWPMTLPWFHPPQVTYRNEKLAKYRDFEWKEHGYITQPSQMPLGLLLKAGLLTRFYFGASLLLGMLVLVPILRTRRHRILWIAAGVVLLQVLIAQSGYPHYLSPAAPIIVLFWVQAMRYFMQEKQGWVVGPRLVTAVVPLMLILIVAQIADRWRIPDRKHANYMSWCCADLRATDRRWVDDQLSAEPGRQLVLVSYAPETDGTLEWVYNEPDIDGSKVVFARDLGPAENEKLFAYFKDRDVWRILFTKDEKIELTRMRSTPSIGGSP